MRTTFESDFNRWPDIWKNTYQILEQSIVSTQLKTWIQPLEWLGVEGSTDHSVVKFGVDKDFVAKWIKDHYLVEMENALAQVLGHACQVEFIVREVQNESLIDEFASPLRAEIQVQAPPKPLVDTRIGSSSLQEIDLRYTFNDFVVGASNQFAHASAVAVAERPGHQYNPLFIYSPPGLGKTHLLHAIGNHIKARNPNARVAYLSAESFANDYIDSIKLNRMSEFRSRYRDSFDVLLVDDVQFLAGRKKTEEEFFHTFNALYGSKRQIVLTSDRPPKEIKDLEERILTRFEWGLVTDIQPPEIETRIAILKTKAESDDIYLPDDVANFLATHIKTNVRELEGVLVKLQAQASLTGAEISLEMAKDQLKNLVSDTTPQFTAENIQTAVAKFFGLRVNDLKSQTRTKNIALARQIAMFLVRKYTGLGYKEIGQHFGGKDHTTVIHACEKIERSLDDSTESRALIEQIQNSL